MPSFFNDLSFRWKIALPILLIAALLLLMILLSVRGFNQLTTASDRLTKLHLPGISLLLNADRDLYQALLAERALLQEPDNAEEQASHTENMQQAQERIHQYLALLPGAETEPLVAQFDQQFERWRTNSLRVVALAEDDPEAALKLSDGAAAEQFGAMRDVVDKLGELQDRNAAAEGQAAIDRGVDLSWQQGIIGTIALLICAVLAIAFPLATVRPLQQLLRRLREIAEGDGDLRVRLDVRSRDELGQISAAFNTFLDKLQTMVREIGRVTGEVNGVARQQADATVQASQLSQREHMAIDQVSTAATEMSAAISEVAQNAQLTADAASSAERQSQQSGDVVRTTISAIEQLAQEVDNASQTIQQLEQEAANIDSVLSVIRGIAEQTNLLALNAAIEAARAGEQGRGFAVVADEVRALAARTQESTKDIQAMIERLHNGVQNAVEAMRAGGEQAGTSVARASGVNEVLEEARTAIRRISDMSAQIATACEEQSSVTDEIARNIHEIRSLSDENESAAQRNAANGRKLADLSSGLSSLVGQFRV